MSTITLPNIRVGSDLQVRVSLKDGGVAIDWSTLSNIKACIYSDAQRALAGRCAFSIDEEDNTLLVCTYAANKPQYLGVNRIVISAKYMGETKTYDKPAFTFVRWTADQEGEEITIDDPDVDVEISVEDVSSSILQEAVDAAFTAADRANDAAEAAEHMVDIHTGPEGKSAYEVAVEEGYTGTEEEWLASLKGPVGETPDISIGTVTTVEPGTPAAASMSGTPEAPVLNLSIPKGLVGATPNITVGTVTTGQPGTPVVITITGTAEAPVLNVTIPQGLKGDTGVSADYPITIHNGLDSDATDEALAAAQGKILDGKVSQLEAEVTGVTSIIDKQVGINLYDGNGTVDGQYVVDAIVPIDANNEKLVLSTAGRNAAYFYGQKFVDANGVETAASYENQGYSPNEQRNCQRFAIPTNAKYFKFSYRFTSASIQVLVHDVMVTYGTTYYNDFYPYEEGFGFKNPIIKPYADYLKTPVYISPSGNDANDGSIEHPFYTFGRALSTGRDIVVRGGLFPYQSSRSFVAISFGSSPYRKVKISAYEGETPIILAGIKLAETATLMQGSTKVYEKTVALNPNSKWIFQYGIPDTNTLIQESERTTYHKGRDVRNPYCTAMRLVGSIAEVESNENYTYFYDSDAGKIYFSCPEVPTADNPIYMADISAFAGASGKELHISGLVILGGAFYIKGCVDSYIESVTVVGSRLGAGFTLDDVTNCTLVKCEASFIDAGASSFGGDGFNAHGTIKTDFRLIDCYSHDNNNDGYSDHENCYGIIQGGLFEHNCIGGQGGGITPAYGACDEIRDVISQNNLADGIRYSSQSGATKNGVIVMNSVSRNNAQNGYHTDSVAKMELINCVAYGNARGFKGNAAQNILAINSKSVGNTNADEYVTII